LEVQFQVSLQAYSIVSSVFHPRTSFALVGIAKQVSASPSLLPCILVEIFKPAALSKAATSSRTLVPRPVPKLKAENPLS
jgi:hypothetical protein